MKSIEDRIVQLLLERKYNTTLHPQSDSVPNWTVTFRDDSGILNVITPLTHVSELWWLQDSVDDEPLFDVWIKEVDSHFNSEYGMNHHDFASYNWTDEFDNGVSAADAFQEWKNMNEAGTLGG